MKTGQKQLQNIAKSEPAKTNNSNAHSCALTLLLFIYKSLNINALKNQKKDDLPVFWCANKKVLITNAIFLLVPELFCF